MYDDFKETRVSLGGEKLFRENSNSTKNYKFKIGYRLRLDIKIAAERRAIAQST